MWLENIFENLMFYGPQCGKFWYMLHVYLKRICIQLLLGEVVYKYHLCQVECYFLYPYWFCSINYWQKDVEIYNCGFVCFPLLIYQFLLFWNFVLTYKKCLGFLNCLDELICLIMKNFILGNILCCEICFDGYGCCHFSFLLVSINLVSLFLSYS